MGEPVQRRPATKFEDLVVWPRAHALVLSIYRLSAMLLTSEAFGLVAQMRRAAVSVAANIVEGFQRKSTTEKLRFLTISRGSLQEVRYFLILVEDLKFGETLDLQEDLAKVGRLLAAYMRGIERRMESPS